MRKANREVKDRNEIIEIMKKCDVCRLVVNNGDYPYIIPLNFGLDTNEEKIILYFHSALEGTKIDIPHGCQGCQSPPVRRPNVFNEGTGGILLNGENGQGRHNHKDQHVPKEFNSQL